MSLKDYGKDVIYIGGNSKVLSAVSKDLKTHGIPHHHHKKGGVISVKHLPTDARSDLAKVPGLSVRGVKTVATHAPRHNFG